jgi:hypothetical protein
MVTMHRPDDDPSAEIYNFGTHPSPQLMGHFCFPPLEEDVAVDLDMRPDPPFPVTKGPNALGRTKPFTDNAEVMTESAEDFTHLVIIASKSAMLKLARARYRYNKQDSLLGGPIARQRFYFSWEVWGSTNTRIFEDTTLAANWVSPR